MAGVYRIPLEYREKVESLVAKAKGIPDRTDDVWTHLMKDMTPASAGAILKHASGKIEDTVAFINGAIQSQKVTCNYKMVPELTPDSSKSLRPSKNSGKTVANTENFKAHTRIIAVRVVVDTPADIPIIADAIQAAVKSTSAPNKSYATPSSVNVNKGKPDDIVCFIRLFCAPVAYLVRVQIGLDFTFYTFNVNTAAEEAAETDAKKALKVFHAEALWVVYNKVKPVMLEFPSGINKSWGRTEEEESVSGKVKDALKEYRDVAKKAGLEDADKLEETPAAWM